MTFKADLKPEGIEILASVTAPIVGSEGIIKVIGANNGMVYDFMCRMIKRVNRLMFFRDKDIVKAGRKNVR
ncbi:MAG: hypothetical protein LKF31_01630 [Muribaculaceae bacterium]|nr:hypothetical protein [Muribaculaceae bacterium]